MVGQQQTLAIAQHAHGQQAGWRAGEHLIDALPYVDTITPEARKQVGADVVSVLLQLLFETC